MIKLCWRCFRTRRNAKKPFPKDGVRRVGHTFNADTETVDEQKLGARTLFLYHISCQVLTLGIVKIVRIDGFVCNLVHSVETVFDHR